MKEKYMKGSIRFVVGLVVVLASVGNSAGSLFTILALAIFGLACMWSGVVAFKSEELRSN